MPFEIFALAPGAAVAVVLVVVVPEPQALKAAAAAIATPQVRMVRGNFMLVLSSKKTGQMVYQLACTFPSFGQATDIWAGRRSKQAKGIGNCLPLEAS
jgi:hypothetical protein